MPRKLRLEAEGGLYHVINRGNYRADVFATEGAKHAFESALAEGIGHYGWRLHAYVIMSNHYHLALETPQPNMGDGMHWLQSTFATRFNRLRKERGHLFQGRYHSLHIEDSAALARVVDYIHLNPVRAGIETPEHLGTYPWSSLRRFVAGDRLEGQTGDLVMMQLGRKDTKAAWKRHLLDLRDLAEDEAEQRRLGFDQMSRGWAIGSAGWKRALAKEHANLSLLGMAREDARLLREARWERVLESGARPRGRSVSPAKQRDRLLGLARELRAQGAPYAWIVDKLGFKSIGSLRVRLHRAKNVTM